MVFFEKETLLWPSGTAIHGWGGGTVCGVVAGGGETEPALMKYAIQLSSDRLIVHSNLR